MTTVLSGSVETVSLPEEDAHLARDTSLALAGFVRDDERRLMLRLEDRESGQAVEVTVPTAALRLLVKALASLSEGHSVTLLALDADLSTQQAADLLGVSRPYFVKLLEEGRLPFRKVGAQRRVRLEALRRYVASYQQEASAALGEMSADAQRAGLYE
jgi:excisionase family DNA binding protein